MEIDLLVHNAAQLITCSSPGGPKRGRAMTDVGLIPNGAVAIAEGKIVEVGPSAELRAAYTARSMLDASGKVVCPGFVDPHTHLVYVGDRVAEFELRIQGASYMDILRSGGGILSTTRATRTATLEDLVAASRPRMDAMFALGTTAAEVKTGYGLDTRSELKMLQAIAALDAEHPADLVPTFLGAHAIPAAYQGRSDDYVDLVIGEMLPRVAEWYRASAFAARRVPLFCDVFCEAHVFDRNQAKRVLQAGLAHGLPAKIHADEFQTLGGVALAVELNSVSADHLDATPPAEIEILAASSTLGVVLPVVNLNMGSSHFADARAMIDTGVALALATDLNPGSAPCPSMALTMAIACRYQRLLPAEAINAGTINAAHAIGLGDRIGSIEVGKQADLLVLKVPDYRHLAYQFGVNLVERVLKRGHLQEM